MRGETRQAEQRRRVQVSVKLVRIRWRATDLPASVIEGGPSRGTYGYDRRIETKLTEVAGSFGSMVVHGLWEFTIPQRTKIALWMSFICVISSWNRLLYQALHVAREPPSVEKLTRGICLDSLGQQFGGTNTCQTVRMMILRSRISDQFSR
jgi:hypothetical protein